jgi:hypothetical protein
MFIWFQVAKENALLLINRNEGRRAKICIEDSKNTVLSTVQVDYANTDIPRPQSYRTTDRCSLKKGSLN